MSKKRRRKWRDEYSQEDCEMTLEEFRRKYSDYTYQRLLNRPENKQWVKKNKDRI